MELDLKIESTLGVTYAEVPLRGGEITEVTGPNASGKTSVAACAQAILTRTANPFGLKASDARRDYPNDGADPGEARVVLDVHVEDPESGKGLMWDEVWRPASATVTAPPNDPLSSREAVGLIDWRGHRDANERAEALQRALLPPVEQIREQVVAALAKYLDREDVDGVIGELDAKNWAGSAWAEVARVYGDRGRQAKRDWKRATGGETYGVAKAADWRPEGWLSSWDSLTPTAAVELFAAAQESVETLLRVQAITEAEAEAAAAAAEHATLLQGDLDTVRAEERQAITDLAAVGMQTSLNTARDADATVIARTQAVKVAENHVRYVEQSQGWQECPHCSNPVTTDGDRVVAYDVDAHHLRVEQACQDRDARKAELVEAKEALAAATEQRDQLAMKTVPIETKLDEIKRRVSTLSTEMNVQRRLARISGDVVGDDHNRAVSDAQQTGEDARVCRDAVAAAHRAAQLHASVVKYSDVAQALGPQGIRAKLLEYGLGQLAINLARVGELTGWPLVEVSDNGTVKIGRRTVLLASESEQWRAQASMQLSLASMTGARVVVLDRADLLDAANRAALWTVLRKVLAACPEMAVLVCSTWGSVDGGDAAHTRVVLTDGTIIEGDQSE